MPSEKEIQAALQAVCDLVRDRAGLPRINAELTSGLGKWTEEVTVALSAAEKERNGSGDRSLLTRVLEESPSLPGGGWRVSRGLAADIEAHLGDGYDWEHPGREGEVYERARRLAIEGGDEWCIHHGFSAGYEADAEATFDKYVAQARSKREGDVIEKLREWAERRRKRMRLNTAQESMKEAARDSELNLLLAFLDDLQEQSTPKEDR